MTPTGRATGFEVYGDNVIQAYLPYDMPVMVNRFFRHFSPQFGVLMETEVWPNLLAAAQRNTVPVVLANARLSARSARAYRRIESLIRPAFAAFKAVAAQTPQDAQRLRELGVSTAEICGNLKFDVTRQKIKLALAGTGAPCLATVKSGWRPVPARERSLWFLPRGASWPARGATGSGAASSAAL